MCKTIFLQHTSAQMDHIQVISKYIEKVIATSLILMISHLYSLGSIIGYRLYCWPGWKVVMVVCS